MRQIFSRSRGSLMVRHLQQKRHCFAGTGWVAWLVLLCWTRVYQRGTQARGCRGSFYPPAAVDGILSTAKPEASLVAPRWGEGGRDDISSVPCSPSRSKLRLLSHIQAPWQG
jgi:hypothetical protein